jgi:predicted amidophosphoribosyltransferase
MLESGFLTGIDCIIPVPLHRSKERKRGFNQSQVIAEGIASVSDIRIICGNLVRKNLTDTQTVRSRIERWGNVEGIFTVTGAGQLKDLHVLLVDDVITTGSTIDACATALSTVEGIRISAVSLAVAPGL